MTALQTFISLKARGVVHAEDTGKLTVKAPAGILTPELRQDLQANKKEIAHLARLVNAGWELEAAALIVWFTMADLILEVPFSLPLGRVVDSRLFFASLDRDIRQGSRGLRAAALIQDLTQLRCLMERLHGCAVIEGDKIPHLPSTPTIAPQEGVPCDTPCCNTATAQPHNLQKGG